MVAALVGGGFVHGCGDSSDPSGSGYNVLLLTLDTTRADHLGCYGRTSIRTPSLDGLAASGALFENAYTTAVLTLPSHASILTGLLPPEHGVRANGNYRLQPASTTLAEILGQAGWKTGAAVGAFVLDSMFGLDQGFAAYDDELAPVGSLDLSHAERNATAVTDAALEFLAGAQGERWFLWAHYFDAHQPYNPPPAFVQEYAPRLYDAEIAYMDSEIGRLLAAIRERGQAERTIVVVVADHGEGFREHGELTHGVFLYDETARVPLIFSAPGLVSGGRRVGAVVRTTDIVPTLLDLLGLPEKPQLDGRSLRPLMEGDRDDLELLAYGESPRPLLGFGWSPLASLREGRWKYIEAPDPELYDLAADPKEKSNLAASNAQVAADLRAKLVSLHDAAVESGRGSSTLLTSPDEQEKLRALGYTGSDDKAAKTLLDSDPKVLLQGGARGLVDPKSRVEVLDQVNAIFVAFSTGRFDETVALADALLGEHPENSAVRQYRADALRSLGRLEEALAEYGQILARDPSDVDALLNSGWVLMNLQRFEEAEQDFQLALALHPDHPYGLSSLANLRLAQGDDDGALQFCQRVLEKNPDQRQCLLTMAQIHQRQGRIEDAKACYAKAADLAPKDLATRLLVAWLQFTTGEHDKALASLDLAEAIDPSLPEPAFARGDVFLALKRFDEAEQAYREGARRAPHLAQGLHGLGLVAEQKGELELAATRYREALRVDPSYAASTEGLERLARRSPAEGSPAPDGQD
jgi:arylsulfatase A-like enzyme/Tfp pilus assembly protein PilF